MYRFVKCLSLNFSFCKVETALLLNRAVSVNSAGRLLPTRRADCPLPTVTQFTKMCCDPSKNASVLGCNCIKRIPTDLVRLIQQYAHRIDYRNLMNTDSSTFKSVKYETFGYTLKCLSKQSYSQRILDIMKKVKDQSKQICVWLISMEGPEIHNFLESCQSVKQIHIVKPVQPINCSYNFLKVSSTLSALKLSGIKERGDFDGDSYLALQYLELVACDFECIQQLGRRENPLKMVIICDCPYLCGFTYPDSHVTTLKLDYMESTRLNYTRCPEGCELINNKGH
jgi:hypothetical protein